MRKLKINIKKRTYFLKRTASLFFESIILGSYNLLVCVAFSSLIYTGHLSALHASGLSLLLLGGIITFSVTSLLSSVRTLIAQPQNEPLPLFMLISATIAGTLAGQAHNSFIFPTVVCAIGISTILTGIFLFLLGKFKVGNLVSLIPYPVLAGFFTGVSLFLFNSSIILLTEKSLGFQNFFVFFEPFFLLRWGPACFLGILFFILDLKKKSYFIFLFIAGSILLFYLGSSILEISLTTLKQKELLVNIPLEVKAFGSFKDISFHNIDWGVILSQSDNIILIIVFSSVSMLLKVTGLEASLKKEVKFNHELKAAGISNIFTGMVGGVVGFLSTSATLFNAKMQARDVTKTRLVGILCAGFFCTILLYGFSIVAYIPLFVPGSILIYMALVLIHKWLFGVRHLLTYSDYSIILSILLVCIFYQIIYGVLVGIIFCFLVFLFNYSKISIIKYILTGKQIHSRKQREPAIEKWLLGQGDRLLYVKLQNYLFFGNLTYLIRDLQARIEDLSSPINYVIYDFSGVTGIDSSFALHLKRLRRIADRAQIILIFGGVESRLRLLFRKIKKGTGIRSRTFRSYDAALEWCEEQLIIRHKHEIKQLPAAEAPLAGVTNGEGIYFKRLLLKKGDVLFHQGDPPKALYYIESGSLDVLLQTGHKEKIRLRTMAPGNIVGETSFYLERSKNATIVASSDCCLQEFSAQNILRLYNDNPQLAANFHCFIVKVLAERVDFMNRQVEILYEYPSQSD